jgi:hypothetical protein
VRIDRSTVHHARSDALSRHIHCEKLDQSIVDQNAVADVNVVGEVIVRDRNFAFLLEPFVHENEILTGLHVDRARNVANAYTRALEVSKYRDRSSHLVGNAPHERNRLHVL